MLRVPFKTSHYYLPLQQLNWQLSILYKGRGSKGRDELQSKRRCFAGLILWGNSAWEQIRERRFIFSLILSEKSSWSIRNREYAQVILASAHERQSCLVLVALNAKFQSLGSWDVFLHLSWISCPTLFTEVFLFTLPGCGLSLERMIHDPSSSKLLV